MSSIINEFAASKLRLIRHRYIVVGNGFQEKEDKKRLNIKLLLFEIKFISYLVDYYKKEDFNFPIYE